MKNLVLRGAFAEAIHQDAAHPGLRRAKFVYCDDQPNSNGFGIKYEDFPELKNTLLGTPLKIRFAGTGPVGHRGSIPIGHINGFEEAEADGVHSLIIDTTLFADDYPDEIEWLEAAYEEGKNDPTKMPGVSFEVTYHDTLLENGVNWLKGLVARAAAIVAKPAYGSRTALLALASDKTLSADDFMTELSALVNNDSPKIPVKGGNNNMTEEEIRKLQEKLAEAEEALAKKEDEVAEKEAKITELTGQNETLTTELSEKSTALAEYQEKEVLESRKAALAEAGITFEIKPERFIKMAEEEFSAYVEDLKAAVESAAKKDPKEEKRIALASSKERLPKFTPSGNKEPVTVQGLAERLRSYSRSTTSEEDTE